MLDQYKLSPCDMGQHQWYESGIKHKVWTSGNTTTTMPPEGVPSQVEWKCTMCDQTILLFEGETPQ